MKIWEYVETDRLVRKAGKTFTTWRPWLSIKPSANLAGLLALPCRIAEFSCVPPHNEEEKTVDPDELSTTNTKLLNNYFWQIVICIHHKIYWKHLLYSRDRWVISQLVTSYPPGVRFIILFPLEIAIKWAWRAAWFMCPAGKHHHELSFLGWISRCKKLICWFGVQRLLLPRVPWYLESLNRKKK